MNRRLLAALVVLGFATIVLADGPNLVPNGGFETLRQTDFIAGLTGATRSYYDGAAASPFEGWAFGGRWDRGDYTVAVADQAHTGQRACAITCRKRGRGGIACAPLQLKPGTAIQVSFWLKAQDATGGRIFLNFEGAPGDGWAQRDLRTGTFDWTRFTKRVTVPEGKGPGMQTIVIFIYTQAEGTVWIDDFAVEVIDAKALTQPEEPLPAARQPRPITEPADSAGYRVQVVSPLTKVFREDDYAPGSAEVRTEIALAAARNEYESAQLVIEAPWRAVTIRDVQVSDLTGPGGATIPASAINWQRVDYVQTTVEPPYFAPRGLGWYPDPLLPAGPFTVEKLSRAPIWLTLHTPREAPAGTYRGTVTIIAEGAKPIALPVTLTLWDFTLPDATHLRTLTWLGGGVIRAFYGNDWSPAGERRHAAIVHAYEDLLLEHRLGPGGEVAASVPKTKDGYDFAPVDANLQRLIGKGMNAFLMGTAPNLKREGKKEYSPEFVRDFGAMVKAYGDHLEQKGWLDRAYVYTYDEAPREAWPEVKKIAAAVKAAAPRVRLLQCLNEPEGVKELTGHIDVFDVYVAQYHKAGVAASQRKGAEVWLAVCCYPMDHPNFFLEYPLLDLRVTPWICWKYGAAGFEYWSPNAWGPNYQKKPDKWPKAPWVANTFGRYNGDGYLVYPGADGRPWSSLRLEALRDGLEDYEYLWLLRDLVQQAEAAGKTGPAVDDARRLLTLDELVKDTGSYAPDAQKYPAYRAKVAAAMVALRAR